MNLPVAGLHSSSLSFAQREVIRTKRRAQRAIAHLKETQKLEIPELRGLSQHAAETAVNIYRGALAKRAFEIRQLSA